MLDCGKAYKISQDIFYLFFPKSSSGLKGGEGGCTSITLVCDRVFQGNTTFFKSIIVFFCRNYNLYILKLPKKKCLGQRNTNVMIIHINRNYRIPQLMLLRYSSLVSDIRLLNEDMQHYSWFTSHLTFYILPLCKFYYQ